MKFSVTCKHYISPLFVSAMLLATGCSTVQQPIPGQSTPAFGEAIDDTGKRDKSDRVKRHIYAATGLGISRMNPDASQVPAFTVNDRVERGGQVTLGADLSRQLAVEVHSADLGSAGFSPGGRINYHIAGASALVYAGKNRHNFKRRGFTGFGLIGVGVLENSPVGNVPFEKVNATHVLFGAGIEYMTSLGLGVRAEGISFEEDAQFAQLGLIYRTGRRSERKPVEIVQAPAPVYVPEPEPVAAVPADAPDPCVVFDGVLEGVNFHTDSAQLTDTAVNVLDGVASTLSQCDSAPISLSAHTDSVGAEAYNQDLSKRRAQSVLRYLESRGIDSSRITARAFGETQPIDSNDTAQGRSRNRRVELIAH